LSSGRTDGRPKLKGLYDRLPRVSSGLRVLLHSGAEVVHGFAALAFVEELRLLHAGKAVRPDDQDLFLATVFGLLECALQQLDAVPLAVGTHGVASMAVVCFHIFDFRSGAHSASHTARKSVPSKVSACKKETLNEPFSRMSAGDRGERRH
jgi:hypothetical protein